MRRDKVAQALEWLKLNHEDYADLSISYKNLSEYPENVPPVIIDYHQAYWDQDPEATAVNGPGEGKGTMEGGLYLLRCKG